MTTQRPILTLKTPLVERPTGSVLNWYHHEARRLRTRFLHLQAIKFSDESVVASDGLYDVPVSYGRIR